MQRTLLIESSRRVGVRLEVRDGEGMRRGHDGDEEQHVEPHLSFQLGFYSTRLLFCLNRPGHGALAAGTRAASGCAWHISG